MMFDETFEKWIKEFDIAQNALEQRELIRYNGKGFHHKENLAEHSHLVAAIVMKLLDKHDSHSAAKTYNGTNLYRAALMHDASELLRGDILAHTKMVFPEIRKQIDAEEDEFFKRLNITLTESEKLLLKYADILSRLLYLGKELSINSTESTREMYDFNYGLCKIQEIKLIEDAFFKLDLEQDEVVLTHRIEKGYKEDAGIDMIMDHDEYILPMSVKTFSMNLSLTPDNGDFATINSRGSTCKKGLFVMNAPVDSNYDGPLYIMCMNISNEIIHIKKGEAFCQYVLTKRGDTKIDCKIKKEGNRTKGVFGSTGNHLGGKQ